MRLPAPPGMHPERGPHGTLVWGPPGPGSLPQCSGGGMQEGLAPGRVWEAPAHLPCLGRGAVNRTCRGPARMKLEVSGGFKATTGPFDEGEGLL